MISDIICLIGLVIGIPLVILLAVLVGVLALNAEDEKKRKGGDKR